MELAWLVNTRLYWLCEISQLAEVIEEKFDTNKNKLARQLVLAARYGVQNLIFLKVHRLDLKALRVVGSSDSSFANNRDLFSQLRYGLFFADDTKAAAPVNSKSYKARRVTRFAMSGEMIVFSELFDAATTLVEEPSAMISRTVLVQLFIDSKSLRNVVSKGSRTLEKRRMLDTAAAREGWKEKLSQTQASSVRPSTLQMNELSLSQGLML